METNNPVEWTVEENFKFRLSEMTDKLLEWASQPDGMRCQMNCILLCNCCSCSVIVPKTARELVVSWISQGLKDLSISRPSSRVPWGIPTPSDNDQTVSHNHFDILTHICVRYMYGLMHSVTTSLLLNT